MPDNDKPIRVRLYVEISDTTKEDELEIPRHEWDGMSKKERAKYLYDQADEFLAETGQVVWGWDIADETDRSQVAG